MLLQEEQEPGFQDEPLDTFSGTPADDSGYNTVDDEAQNV